MRIMLLTVLMCAAASAQQDTEIFDPYDTPKRPPFKLHDHLSIVVEERSQALSTTDLRTDRRSRYELSIDNWVRLDTKSGQRFKALPRLRAAELIGAPGIDLDARTRTDNTGRTSRSFNLSFTITAQIIDIRPNGNLVIEAKKRRKVNGEVETIRLSGVVSPQYVNASNQIRSKDIHNLDIEYDGKGTTSDLTKRGWLSWLLDKLWPF